MAVKSQAPSSGFHAVKLSYIGAHNPKLLIDLCFDLTACRRAWPMRTAPATRRTCVPGRLAHGRLLQILARRRNEKSDADVCCCLRSQACGHVAPEAGCANMQGVDELAGKAPPTSNGGTSTSALNLPRRSSAILAAPALHDSCLLWFKKRLELLCPTAHHSLRAGADTPTDFVQQLYDEHQHGLHFVEFLQNGEHKPLFVALSSSREFALSTHVPKQGSYEALMYMLKPAGADQVTWTEQSLSRRLQVRVANLCLPCCALHPTPQQSVPKPSN
jgi:hypothetical protein